MMLTLTYAANLIEMAASLWLAFFLFVRGYPNLTTMRIALTLLALSAYFLGAFNNHFMPVAGSAALRAILLVISMGLWYSAIFSLFPEAQKKRMRWLEYAVYTLSIVTALLLFTDRDAFLEEGSSTTYAAPMQSGLTSSMYGNTLLFVAICTPLTAWMNKRMRATPEGKFLLVVSFFPLFTTLYKIVSLLTYDEIMPRIVQDGLFFAGVFLMGIAVARHQSMLERRTILEELPLTTLVTMIAAFSHGVVAYLAGVPFPALGNTTAVVITTLGMYDLAREVIDRSRWSRKKLFRSQLRTVDNEGGDKLRVMLQEGLDLLCKTLNTDSGFVAAYRDGNARVLAAKNSVEVGSELPLKMENDEGQFRSEGQFPNIEWVSSVFEGRKQVALVGIGASNVKLDFSSGDLELLGDFADHVGALLSLADMVRESQNAASRAMDLQTLKWNSAAEDMMRSAQDAAPSELTPMVEEALRKYANIVALGESPLADWAQIQAETQLERGKKLQQILREAVEALHPGGARPVDVIPRAWYAYIIIHDAYVEGSPNRDVMARLYISEGTFNRTRRSALRGLARWLEEKYGKN